MANPSFASRRATARPIPPDAPVTIAVPVMCSSCAVACKRDLDATSPKRTPLSRQSRGEAGNCDAIAAHRGYGGGGGGNEGPAMALMRQFDGSQEGIRGSGH